MATQGQRRLDWAPSGTPQPPPMRSAVRMAMAAGSTRKFSGRCDALRDFIFDFGDVCHATAYHETLREIINYIKQEYDMGDLVSSVLETGTMPVLR